LIASESRWPSITKTSPRAREVEIAQPTAPSPSNSPPEQSSTNLGRVREQQISQSSYPRAHPEADHGGQVAGPPTSDSKNPRSPLSEETQRCRFSRKFSTPTFDYYSGASDPVQHIRHFRDKKVIYSHNDPVICVTFPSNLKGAVSDWFYFLPPRSLHNFMEVTEAFLTQYASCQETKRNSHHLLFVKMK